MWHRKICFAAAAALVVWSVAALADDAPQPAAATTAHQAEPNAAAKHAAAGAAGHPLDLSAPPVKHVLTPEQVQSLTAEQPDEDGNPPDDVTVNRERYLDPVPTGTFRALPWALLHPLDAWRIFTPITD